MTGIRILSRLIKLGGSVTFYVCIRIGAVIRQSIGKLPRSTAVVLCYHAIPLDHQGRFARQMDLLLRHGKPVRPDFPGKPAPGERLVAVTFDDGHRSVIENALPELRRRSIPCAIFFISHLLGQSAPWAGIDGFDPEDKYATSDDIQKLSPDSVVVGSHTTTHPHLPDVTIDAARRQLVDSRAYLEEITGGPVRLFAFPSGAMNESLVALSAEAGYGRVFSVEPAAAFSLPNEYVTGRVMTDPTDWEIEFLLKIRGAYVWLAPLLRAPDAVRATFGSSSRITIEKAARVRIQSTNETKGA
jgi:peptidoglycan/xylan/chitin deacetylase (PgdA/CDA1 family)